MSKFDFKKKYLIIYLCLIVFDAFLMLCRWLGHIVPNVRLLPALFCLFFFIIHNRPPQMRIYGVTISKMSEELFGNQPVFPEYYQKNISDGNADNAEHGVQNVGGIPYWNKTLIPNV